MNGKYFEEYQIKDGFSKSRGNIISINSDLICYPALGDEKLGHRKCYAVFYNLKEKRIIQNVGDEAIRLDNRYLGFMNTKEIDIVDCLRREVVKTVPFKLEEWYECFYSTGNGNLLLGYHNGTLAHFRFDGVNFKLVKKKDNAHGEKKIINAIVVLPDGRLVTSGADNTTKIW